MNEIRAYLADGWAFARAHPQLWYTAVLLLLIPLAFIISTQQFLQLATDNQERIERERIGMVQDTIAAFARDDLDAPARLQEQFARVAEESPDIGALYIVRQEPSGAYRIVAAGEADRVGMLDERNHIGFQSAALQTDRSLIFETSAEDGRHWVAFRALPDAAGELRHILLTDISMARIDAVARQNALIAYAVLAALLLIVMLVLVRQARLIDYGQLYRRLQEVNKLKDDFVSMAAHELRSPLTAIRGYAELLRGAEKDSQREEQALSRIESSAEQLGLLIEDILDVARLQSGTMSFELVPTRAQQVAREAVELMQSLADEKGIELTLSVESERQIRVDPVRLRQVLVNLISNALKYTPQGSVSVEITQANDRQLISVRDTGIGISAEDQQRLFHKFFRVRSRETAEVRGTGLGLWITRELVHRMNGSIRLESMKGVGSRFIVTFPLHHDES